MSRAYDARRKARRQARAAAELERPGGNRFLRWRSPVLVPVLLIVAILAAIGVFGFGTGGGAGNKQIAQEVNEFLEGIPQEGAVLGSPKAPITVWLYADLECPTVKLFVENYFPAIVETWVRTGAVRIEYRSLQTDTSDEDVFFRQEIASLAAGRQARMWNFLLTFVRQQQDPHSDYVTQEHLTGIASQVPELDLARWRRDRVDALLSRNVALDIYSGHNSGIEATPSFLIGATGGTADRSSALGGLTEVRKELASALRRDMKLLGDEAFGDLPTVGGIATDSRD